VHVLRKGEALRGDSVAGRLDRKTQGCFPSSGGYRGRVVFTKREMWGLKPWRVPRVIISSRGWFRRAEK